MRLQKHYSAAHARSMAWTTRRSRFPSQPQLRPNVHTYGSLIKSYGSLGKLQHCWRLWRELTTERGLVPDDVTLGCMLDALVKNGRAEDALAFFR